MSIASGLRAGGLLVETIDERYGRTHAERVDDRVWIREATADGLILLHADKAIRRRALERQALLDCEARSFCMSNNNMGSVAVVDRLHRHHDRIFDIIATRSGPYFYVVGDRAVESRPLQGAPTADIDLDSS